MNGCLIIAEDGKSWTVFSSFTQDDFSLVVRDPTNTQFWAISNATSLWKSPDGIHWKKDPSVPGIFIVQIDLETVWPVNGARPFYSPSLGLYVCQTQRQIITSSDLVTWSPILQVNSSLIYFYSACDNGTGLVVMNNTLPIS